MTQLFSARQNISNARNVALQLYGPHMDYAANLFTSAKRRLEDINFKYLEELTLNDNGTNNNPVEAFVADPALDAVFCIIPDALNLSLAAPPVPAAKDQSKEPGSG